MITDWLLGADDDVLDKLLPNLRRVSRAESLNEEVNKRLKVVISEYKAEYKRALRTIVDLDRRKEKIIENEFRQFVNLFSKIANIEVTDVKGYSNLKGVQFSLPDFSKIQSEGKTTYEFLKEDALKDSLIPFFGSMILKRKSESIMNDALSRQANVQIQVERMKTEEIEMEALGKLARQNNRIIRKLKRLSTVPLTNMKTIVENGTDWNAYSEEEKRVVVSTMSLMKILKSIIDIPILRQDGSANPDAINVYKNNDLIQLGVIER